MGAVPVVAVFSLLGLPSIPGTNIDLTVPYAAEGSGPTFNTLGQVDGREVVDITGAKTHPTSGNLNMTTVSVRTNMTLAQAFKRWVTTDDTLVPLEHVFPSGKSSEEVQRQNAAAFALPGAAPCVAVIVGLITPAQHGDHAQHRLADLAGLDGLSLIHI